MKKHKHHRYEPDPDAPPRRQHRRAAWDDEWEEELDYEDDDEDEFGPPIGWEDEEDEDWERTLGNVDLWAAHWSGPDSSRAGRWRRASSEGGDADRRSA